MMGRSETWDDAHHIRSAKHPERTLCGQDASKLNTLPASTTVWPDVHAACWTCWDAQGALLRAAEIDGGDLMSRVGDAIRELEGHYAYDGGAVDSGVHDPVRRAELVKIIDATSNTDLRWALSRFIREAYLSEKGLQQGYGWEDAMNFARWFHDGDYRGR